MIPFYYDIVTTLHYELHLIYRYQTSSIPGIKYNWLAHDREYNRSLITHFFGVYSISTQWCELMQSPLGQKASHIQRGLIK